MNVLSVGADSSESDEAAYELKLVPSVTEVVHFENDSYIISCAANTKTRLRWLDPDNIWIDKSRGGVHVEQKNDEELSLVFKSISSAHNGTFICEAEKDNRKISFNMIVYSRMKKRTFTHQP